MSKPNRKKKPVSLAFLPEELSAISIKKMGILDAVYVISPRDMWPCKIGHANMPGRRLLALQTSHWEELHLSHMAYCFNSVAGDFLEAACHETLKAEGVHIRGEWFDIPVDRAVATIAKVAAAIGMDIKTGPAEIIAEAERVSKIDRAYQYDTRPMSEEEKAARNKGFHSIVDLRNEFRATKRTYLSSIGEP